MSTQEEITVSGQKVTTYSDSGFKTVTIAPNRVAKPTVEQLKATQNRLKQEWTGIDSNEVGIPGSSLLNKQFTQTGTLHDLSTQVAQDLIYNEYIGQVQKKPTVEFVAFAASNTQDSEALSPIKHRRRPLYYRLNKGEP